jgi:hypothetical protein
MSRPRPGSTWIRELTRQLRPGYRLTSTGRSKFFVLDSRGRKLRCENGRPLVVPNSPSNYRSVITTRDALRRAGALR